MYVVITILIMAFGKNDKQVRSLADAENDSVKNSKTSSGKVKVAVGSLAALAVVGVTSWVLIGNSSTSSSPALDGADPANSSLSTQGVNLATGEAQLGKPVVVLKEDPTKEDPDNVSTLSNPEVNRSRVDVLIDGWSYRTLENKSINWVGSDTVKGTLVWEKVNADDLAEILRTTPDLLEKLLARTMTLDSRVSCDENGCSVGDRKLDLDGILDPSSVEGFGGSYADWGIESLLYKATIDVSGDVKSVTLEAGEGYNTISFDTLPTGFENEKPNAANGYFRNRYLMSAGLGNMFITDPAWVTGEEKPVATQPGEIGAVDDDFVEQLKKAQPNVAAVEGLGTSIAGSVENAVLTSSVLTYMTSPTTGCGVGILCVPSRVPVSIESRVKEVAAVCPQDTENARNGAVLDDVTISVVLPGRIHQYGLWNGTDPENFEDASGFGLLQGGNAPLVDGEVKIRWSAVGFFDGTNGDIRLLFGAVNSGESVSNGEQRSISSILTQTKPDGYTWYTC